MHYHIAMSVMKEQFDYENDDQQFLHCKHCLDQFLGSPTHEHMSPAEFMDYCASAYPITLDDGAQERVFVLWCKHCKRRVWDSGHLMPRTDEREVLVDGEWRPIRLKKL